MMKVSIITCCYDRVNTIANAIESVLSQTYDNIEYIIVDGGSTDGSRELINKYKDRVAKIIFEADRGMYEGINKGIRAATGDVIALCHTDDVLYAPDTVAEMVKVLEDTGADMAYADGLYLRRRNMEHEEAARVWKSGKCTRGKLRCGWLPLHTTCYVKKEVYDRYGLYDESYKIAADTKFLLNILYKHKIKTAYLPKYVVKMRMGGTSTNIHKMQEMFVEDKRVFKEMGFRMQSLAKVMKMMWKVPQYVRAKIVKIK